MVNTKEYSCTPYCTISKINKKSLLSQFRDSDFSNYANNLGKDQGNPKSLSAPFKLNSEKKIMTSCVIKITPTRCVGFRILQILAHKESPTLTPTHRKLLILGILSEFRHHLFYINAF